MQSQGADSAGPHFPSLGYGDVGPIGPRFIMWWLKAVLYSVGPDHPGTVKAMLTGHRLFSVFPQINTEWFIRL